MGEHQSVDGEDEASRIAEKGRVSELGHSDADVPRGKVERIEDGCNDDGHDQRPARPMGGLAGAARNQPQERERKEKPPEPRCDRTGVREAHEPWPERQRDIAEQKRGEGERMRVGSVAHFERLGTSRPVRKLLPRRRAINSTYDAPKKIFG